MAERVLPIIDSLIIVGSSVVCAVIYYALIGGGLNRVDDYAAAGLLVAINFCLWIVVQDGYQLKTIAGLGRQLRMTATTWTGVFAALLAIGFALKVSSAFSRGVIISFYVVGLCGLLVWKAVVSRWIAHALRTGVFVNHRVVVIAEHGLSGASHAMVELRQHGYRVVQMLEIDSKELGSPLLMSTIGPRVRALIEHVRQSRIDQVLLLMRWDRQHAIDSLLDALKILPIPVHLVPDAHVGRFLRHPLISVGSTCTAELRRAPLSWSERAIKRLIDLAGATLALIIFAPIMLFAAVLIKMDSHGPVLFQQTRHGFTGRDFRIFKFRTMRVMDDGPTIKQATRNDPRVTAIGRWLRKTSIDELPQLFNVLKGDMSLVGPRPHAAAHNSEYQQTISTYAFRHHVKPGITGWAQVNGYRGETRTLEMMQKRVEYDLWYINNWSVVLDITILIKTVFVGFHQRSAY